MRALGATIGKGITPKICHTYKVPKKDPTLACCPTCGTEVGCPKCKTPLSQMPRAFRRKLGASLLSATRPTTSRAGPPKVLKACKFCGEKLGVVEMRAHLPRCPKKRPAA